MRWSLQPSWALLRSESQRSSVSRLILSLSPSCDTSSYLLVQLKNGLSRSHFSFLHASFPLLNPSVFLNSSR